MKIKRLTIYATGIMAVLAIVLAAGCKYNNVDQAYPINTCDTTDVSYSKYIEPLLKTNCYSCHSAGNAGLGGNYVLDNYTDVAKQAKSGFLYGDLSTADINSVSHMPRNAASLPPCDLLKVKAWIDQGAKNN